MKIKALCTVLMLTLAGSIPVLAQESYFSTAIGTTPIRLPNFKRFAPACQEERRVFDAIAAGIPQDQRLVACWVDASSWNHLKGGTFTLTYPTVMVTYAQALGSDWTRASFLEFAAHAEQSLGRSIMTGEPSHAETLLRENRALAQQGVPLERLTNRPRFVGIYDNSPTSFSYLMVRETQNRLAGSPMNVMETSAMTNMLFGRQLILIAVSTQGSSEAAANEVRIIAEQWSRALREANPRHFQ